MNKFTQLQQKICRGVKPLPKKFDLMCRFIATLDFPLHLYLQRTLNLRILKRYSNLQPIPQLNFAYTGGRKEQGKEETKAKEWLHGYIVLFTTEIKTNRSGCSEYFFKHRKQTRTYEKMGFIK